MFYGQYTGFGAGSSGYSADAAHFDGTNDSMRISSDLTGAANTKTHLISGWFNFAAGDGDGLALFQNSSGAGGDLILQRHTSDTHRIINHDTTVTNFEFFSTTTTTAAVATGWHHIMSSWDGTNFHFYQDDVEVKNATVERDVVGIGTGTAWYFGISHVTTQRWDGDAFDFYYDQSYLDLSVEANRRLLIDANGKPVEWASILTNVGTPLVGFHLDRGEAADNFADNADGSGGAFTVTGALTTASTRPTD